AKHYAQPNEVHPCPQDWRTLVTPADRLATVTLIDDFRNTDPTPIFPLTPWWSVTNRVGLVFWYEGCGHDAFDSFFIHGGFFAPTLPPGVTLPKTLKGQQGKAVSLDGSFVDAAFPSAPHQVAWDFGEGLENGIDFHPAT